MIISLKPLYYLWDAFLALILKEPPKPHHDIWIADVFKEYYAPAITKQIEYPTEENYTKKMYGTKISKAQFEQEADEFWMEECGMTLKEMIKGGYIDDTYALMEKHREFVKEVNKDWSEDD